MAQPNGDLAPTAIPILGTPVKLGTLYVLQTPFRSYYDDFFLSTPDFTDANNDGIDDFFQPEIAIEGTTSQGFIEDGVNGAELPIHATWHRDAGASSGSFRIPLPNSTFPRPVPFDVPFEIQNFSGVFITTASGTTASGTLFLRQTDHPNNTLLGDLQVNASGHDQLQIVPGSWLHSKGVAANYLQISALQRAGTNYIGEIVFDQGMPPSPEAHHRYWMLVISDSRDFNQDGVPDLTDPPPPPAPPPRLEIVRNSSGVSLRVFGQAGKYLLEKSNQLSGDGWTTMTTLTLTEPDQLFPLPSISGERALFLRLRTP